MPNWLIVAFSILITNQFSKFENYLNIVVNSYKVRISWDIGYGFYTE